jgi:dTDP-4-amino-4,6-dideoxygalactose transaminase
VGCFSLNGSKNLSAGGEGGFLLTNNRDIFENALSVAMYGKNVSGKDHPPSHITRLGWMYRIQELPAAFARSQLKRLDEYNEIRTRNAEYLSYGLSEIKGIRTPIIPSDRTHAWFGYRLKFDTEEATMEMPVRKFREAIEKALFKEGVPVGQADKMPLFQHPLFQNKNEYSRHCPWSCNLNQNEPQQFDTSDFVNVHRLMDDYTLLRGIHPPNDTELMDLYLEAFHKVFDNLQEVLDKADSLPMPVNNCEMFGGYY